MVMADQSLSDHRSLFPDQFMLHQSSLTDQSMHPGQSWYQGHLLPLLSMDDPWLLDQSMDMVSVADMDMVSVVDDWSMVRQKYF